MNVISEFMKIQLMFSEAYSKIHVLQDIHSILQLVDDHSSLDDISVLEYFVNMFNIEEAKPVTKEYKEAVEELKMKLHQCLKEELLNASPLLKCVTIVVGEYTIDSVLKDVQRLSSDVLPVRVKLNVIRDDDEGVSMWKVWKRKSFADTFDELTAQSKDTTEVPAGIVMLQYINHYIL